MHKANHYRVGGERGTGWSMPIITWLEHIQVQRWRPMGGHALQHWGTEALWEFVAAARTDWVRLLNKSCFCCCFCSTCWSALLIIRPTTIGSAVFPRHNLPRILSLLLLPPPPSLHSLQWYQKFVNNLGHLCPSLSLSLLFSLSCAASCIWAWLQRLRPHTYHHHHHQFLSLALILCESVEELRPATVTFRFIFVRFLHIC